MPPSFNKVLLLGTLVRDPEYRRSAANGVQVCDFRLAVDDTSRKGEAKPALFIDVVAWSALADAVHGALRQGSRALVEGRLQQQEWTGRDGQKRSALRVVASSVQFLDPPEAPAPELLP